MAYLSYEPTGGEESQEVDRSVRWEAILKIISLFGFVALLIVFYLGRKLLFGGGINQVSIKNGLGGIEYVVPYKNTLYENFGFVQDPRVSLPLKTLNGYTDTVFLLDSGAVVTTMPLQAAHDSGVDLTRAKRITLQGFSGVPAFAYLAEVTVQIAGQDYKIPATFTESNSTTYILGRKGFFDDFSILFDHEQRAIIITRKK